MITFTSKRACLIKIQSTLNKLPYLLENHIKLKKYPKKNMKNMLKVIMRTNKENNLLIVESNLLRNPTIFVKNVKIKVLKIKKNQTSLPSLSTSIIHSITTPFSSWMSILMAIISIPQHHLSLSPIVLWKNLNHNLMVECNNLEIKAFPTTT